jgi:hypothetical protein
MWQVWIDRQEEMRLLGSGAGGNAASDTRRRHATPLPRSMI